MYDLDKKLDRHLRDGVGNKDERTTWRKKLDRNLRLGVRNCIEMYVMGWEIRTKWTTWSKKLDRDVRLWLRN